MYKIRLKIIGIIIATLLTTGSLGAMVVTTSPYYMQVNNTDSTNQRVMGLYSFLGLDLNHSVDAEYDAIASETDQSTLQQMYIGRYTYYTPDLYRYKLGVQVIDTEANVQEGNTYSFGIEKDHFTTSGIYLNTIGLSSFYTTHTLSNSTLSAIQVSPFYKAPLYISFLPSKLFIKSQLNHIQLSEDLGFSKQQFTSFEQTASFVRLPFTLDISMLLGEAMYLVEQEGFIILNSVDNRYYRSLKAKMTFFLTDTLNFQAGYQAYYFETKTTNSNTSQSKYFIGLSLSL